LGRAVASAFVRGLDLGGFRRASLVRVDGTNALFAGNLFVKRISKRHPALLGTCVSMVGSVRNRARRLPVSVPKNKQAQSMDYVDDFLAGAEGRTLAKAFLHIKDVKVRRSVVHMVEALAQSGSR
jgi:hypothetical protein